MYITMCFFNLMLVKFCLPYLILLHPNVDIQAKLIYFHNFLEFCIGEERIYFGAILTSYMTIFLNFRNIKYGKIFNKEIYQDFMNITKKYLRLNFFYLFLVINLYIIINILSNIGYF